MQTITETYKGYRTIELSEDVDLPDNASVLVVIPDKVDGEIRVDFIKASEAAFAKIWDNKGDEVWNEYL